MKRSTLLLILVLTCRAAVAAQDPSPEAAADKRPTTIWTRTGPLGDTPQHVTDAFPLSDQQNKGGWVKYEPMTDEFRHVIHALTFNYGQRHDRELRSAIEIAKITGTAQEMIDLTSLAHLFGANALTDQ